MRNISSVEDIVGRVRELFSTQYPHLVRDNVAEISYLECEGRATFEEIKFESVSPIESLRVRQHCIYLDAADGTRYKLISYNNIADLFCVDPENIKKEVCGPTRKSKAMATLKDDLTNDLICALGTQLTSNSEMTFDQIKESANKMAEYFICHGYMKGDCL
jgi:hypothetical protein